MTNASDLDGAISGGGAGRVALPKGTPIGTTVSGVIKSAMVQQRRDYVTGEPKVWGDGNPQQQIAISIQTALRTEPDDDGVRGVYVKVWGRQRDALVEAVRAAGYSKLNEALVPGNHLEVTFTGTAPSNSGNDENLYAYKITRGVQGLDQAVATPQAAQAPVATSPAPVAAPPAAPPAAAPAESPVAKAKQLAALGIDHPTIAAQLGVDISIVPALLASAA